MAFLSKGKKEDLLVLAEELGLDVSTTKTVVGIRKLILGDENYEEEEMKISLTRIIDERLQKEKEEKEREEKEKEREEKEKEERLARERMQHDLEMKRLELSQNDSVPMRNGESEKGHRIQLTQITPKFDEKRDEMGLYLINFERKAQLAQVPKKEWTAYLLSVLPAEISNMLAREPVEKANDYDYVKSLILKRYRLNTEKLKQCFYRHQRTPEKSWRNYTHELYSYFTEWIEDLEVSTFQQLKDLIITEQLKFRVPAEVREHFLDDWMKMKTPYELAEKLDEYESIKQSFRKKEFPQKNHFKFRGGHHSGFKQKESKKEFINENQIKKEISKERNPEKEFEKRKQLRCYECGSFSHLRPQCDELQKKVETVASNMTAWYGYPDALAPYTSMGKVNGMEMPILRDTGASLDLICKKYVKPSMYLNETVWIRTPLEENPTCLPLAEVEVDCELGHIVTKAAVLRDSLDQGRYLLGNKTVALFEEAKKDEVIKIHMVNAVQTRAQRKLSEVQIQSPEAEEIIPENSPNNEAQVEDNILPLVDLQIPELELMKMSPKEFVKEQRDSPELKPLFQEARSNSSSKKSRYMVKNQELFFRKEDKDGTERLLLVVPEKYRTQMMTLCHEGTVFQIMPDATLVAVSVKDLPASNASSVVFKNPSFPSDTTQSTLNLPNLLTEAADNNESEAVPVCSEENISDIDLSFLNETGTMPDNKCLHESTVKELQGMIGDVSSQSLNLLQNNLNLAENKSIQEQGLSDLETSKDPEDPPGDVVMIDVTKPIQLSQNSLIMVNGQKCILHHDPQTGQVIAYPVKEQDKPRRRRGRPRKASTEQSSTQPTENTSIQETESFSEEEREKGLLEVVNDDGALVRRSSRKRKKAKVLRDYETGNLKQELGSDVDETEVVDKDIESFTRRKKMKGPGRPRKYVKAVENIPNSVLNNAGLGGVKRQRGRPRKTSPENEPTQAFLVQTADGQTLMMQIPLSSIPAGISLQEMAQEIANKLNQASTVMDMNAKQLNSAPVEELTMESVPEPALQDHSIGSTTNFSGLQTQLNCTEGALQVVDNPCQDVINMNDIIANDVCHSEVILESENSAKEGTSILTENIPDPENSLNTLDVPQCSTETFCINVPSTTTSSIDNTTLLCHLNDHLIDHNFYVTKSTDRENLQQAEVCESSKMPKEIFIKSDALKDKVDFQLLLDNETDIDAESQNINVDQMLNRKFISSNSVEMELNVDKNADSSYNTNVMDSDKSCVEKQYLAQQIPEIDCSTEPAKDALGSSMAEEQNGDCIQNESVIQCVESSDVIDNGYLNSTERDSPPSDSTMPENQAFEIILPLQKTEPLPSDKSVGNSSAATVIPVSEKVLPMLLPSEPQSGTNKCKICQMPYFTEEEIIEHFKARHPKCICMECNYMNEHPYGIRRHSYRHTNQECVCSICKKKYKDLYILKMHIKMVHLPPEILFKCETCGKQFTRKAHLKRHQRIHAAVKQYQCPHCDYKGCEKSDITKHLLIHEEPKYKCEICGKAFRHIKNKGLHLKRHSGQRDYKCAACNFYGYTYTDIRKHIERRHSAVCSLCKQIFTDVELLKEHKRLGLCLLEENGVVKIEECTTTLEDSKEIALYNEIPIDILDPEQPQVMTCTVGEETLSALQNGQLVMTSVESILNRQLVVDENNLLNSDGLSVISVERDANKMITLVTSSGKNASKTPEECANPMPEMFLPP